MPAYNRAKKQDGSFDWDDGSQTFRLLLVTSSYTPNPDHDFVSDVVANEATGTGYVRKDVTGRSVTIDDANDRVDHDANNVTWTTLTSVFRYAILFRNVTNDADSPVLYWFDLGAQNLTASDFNLKWNNGATSGTVFRGT